VGHSSVEENGMNHHCLFNKHEDQCHCQCWGARPTYVERAHGHHTFTAEKSGVAGTRCNSVKFATPFDPKLQVKVIATVSQISPSPVFEKDSTVVFVKSTSSTDFEVCADESAEFWQSAEQSIAIEFYAFSGPNNGLYGSPWPGAYGGNTEALGTNWNAAQTNCHTVKFPKKFGGVPMVLGSVEGKTAMAYWVENINQMQYRVCFKSALPTDVISPFTFTWAAFEHKNPSLWFRNKMPYSIAGRESSGIEKPGLHCKDVSFGQTFDSPPSVLVTANYFSAAVVDWGSSHESTETYMSKVTTSGFNVCTTGKAQATGLSWDWVAFGDHL
jgi:hypothetical protein